MTGLRAGVAPREALLALLAYVLLTLLFFNHYLPLLNDFIIGPLADNVWIYWCLWLDEQICAGGGQSFDFTDYLYFPEGNAMAGCDWSFYNLAVARVLRALFFRPFLYNFLILHAFVLSGLGGYLLIRYLTGSRLAALAGGFVYAFSPAQVAHTQYHLGQISIQFIPFFILYLIRCLRTGGTRRDLALAALFFLLNALCSLYFFVYALYFLLFAYLYLAWRRRRWLLPGVLGRMALIAGVTLLVLLPRLGKMAAMSLGSPATIQRPTHDIFVVDLAALVIPHPYHWLTENCPRLAEINSGYTGNNWEATAYLGWANLALILAAGTLFRPEARRYLLGFLAFLALALGSHLHVAGYVTGIPLPYAVLQHVPLLNVARAPNRLRPFLYLFLAIMVAHAVRELWQRRGRLPKVLLVVLLLMLVADFYSDRREATCVEYVPAYAAMANDGPRYGVLDLPGGELRYTMQYMMYQTFHGKPIVHGHNARRVGTSLRDYLELADLARQRRQLTDGRVRYIVVHKPLLTDPYSTWPPVDLARYRAAYTAVHEDEQALVLRVY